MSAIPPFSSSRFILNHPSTDEIGPSHLSENTQENTPQVRDTSQIELVLKMRQKQVEEEMLRLEQKAISDLLNCLDFKNPHSLSERLSLFPEKKRWLIWKITCKTDLEGVKLLMQNGFTLELEDEMGNNGIHFALHEDLGILEYLVQYKSGINKPNKKGLKPLDMLLCEHSNDPQKCVKFAEILILNGATVNLEELKILCVLFKKIPNKNLEAFLLEHNCFLFLKAAIETKYIEKLLERYQTIITLSPQDRRELISFILDGDQEGILKYMLSYNVFNASRKFKGGNSLLHCAADRGAANCMLYLADYLQINQINEMDEAPLDILIKKHMASAYQTILEFIRKNAVPNQDQSKVELWNHMIMDPESNVEILLENNIYFPAADLQDSSFHLAARYASWKNFERMVKNPKINIDFRNLHGRTPLNLLCGSTWVVESPSEVLARINLLLKHGALVNFAANDGYAPLVSLCNTFFQSQKSKEVPAELLQTLIGHGADIKPALAFYKEVTHTTQKTFKITSGGNYNAYIDHKVGSVQWTTHHQGFTPRTVQHVPYWTTKHYRKEQAPNTYKLLTKLKSK